jgi:hypothetical protein
MMEALGRLFNVAPIAAGTLISLKDAAGVTFVCTGNDTFTVKSANTYNGSATALTAITRYYSNTSTAGGAAWTDSGDLANAVSAVTIASGVVVFYIDAADLPAGAEYVEVTVAASGLVQAITHDLLPQRTPKLMRQLSGSAS